jgi:hypothetical protein
MFQGLLSYLAAPSSEEMPQEVRAFFGTMRTALQARHYARSERGELQVRLLGDQTALVSTSVVRYATDGTELERFGATYILLKGTPLKLAPDYEAWLIEAMSHGELVALLDLLQVHGEWRQQ